MGPYLNRPEVRRAIHAMELYEWKECSGPVNRALGHDNMIASRPLIVRLMDDHKVPVLVYNGQFDLICNHIGTEAYLSTMSAWSGLPEWLKQQRGQWVVDGNIAGYTKAYGKLTFLLVLGGSHMCPMDVPKQAFDMIHRFMSGKNFEDEYPGVNVPFTPTVPYIPGDVIHDEASPHKDHPHNDAAADAPIANSALALQDEQEEGPNLLLLVAIVGCVLLLVAWVTRAKRRDGYEAIQGSYLHHQSDVLLRGED